MNFQQICSVKMLNKYDKLNLNDKKVFKYLLSIYNNRPEYAYKGVKLLKGQAYTNGMAIANIIGSSSHKSGLRVLDRLVEAGLITKYSNSVRSGKKFKGYTIISITDVKGSVPCFQPNDGQNDGQKKAKKAHLSIGNYKEVKKSIDKTSIYGSDIDLTNVGQSDDYFGLDKKDYDIIKNYSL